MFPNDLKAAFGRSFHFGLFVGPLGLRNGIKTLTKSGFVVIIAMLRGFWEQKKFRPSIGKVRLKPHLVLTAGAV
jgi:hypothetical protein